MDLAELQAAVTSLGAAVGIVGLLAAKTPDDKQVAETHQAVVEAHMRLSGYLHELVAARNLADYQARNVADLEQSWDPNRYRSPVSNSILDARR